MFLRQSTASQEIMLGRFVDSTDGNTEETGLTIANTDIKIFKGGATTLASKNSGGGTHVANGMYSAVLDATDTDTVGELEVHVHVAGALSVMRRFWVLEEAVFDALFAASATGLLPANVTQFGGSNGTFASGRPEVNTTHAAGTAWGSGAITSGVFASGAINAAAIATDAITAAKIAADAITSAKIATDAIGAAQLAADAVTEIQSGLATAAAVSTIDDFLDTEIASIIATLGAAGAGLTGIPSVAAIGTGGISRASFAADTGLQTIRSNTAQAGGATSITLDASASLTTDFYKGDTVFLTGGTGAGQYRLITAYNGTTKVATVTPAWATNPDSSSTFAVLPIGMVDIQAFLGSGSPTQVTVNDIVDGVANRFSIPGTVSDATPAAGNFDAASGLSGSDDFYNGAYLVFTSGALDGIARKISDYTGSTRTFAFTGPAGAADAPFPTAPADADAFVIIGRG